MSPIPHPFSHPQVTRGGGALTLASQWKSQFDDSEETTDNEWKQEPQSPSHHCGPVSHPVAASGSMHYPTGGGRPKSRAASVTRQSSADAAGGYTRSASASARRPMDAQELEEQLERKLRQQRKHRHHLNIAGIENYEHLQDVLPHCWSEPALGNVLRRQLEPPVLQQAAFDDTVSVPKGEYPQ